MNGQIDEFRDDAARWLDIAEGRYGGDTAAVPLQVAVRWHGLLNRSPLDLDAMGRLVQEAERDQNRFDVGFFGFCNDMRRMYEALREESSSRK